jgi:hypothetical protein
MTDPATAMGRKDSRSPKPTVDDAKSAAVVRPDKLPAPMAFDHAGILADYLVWKRTGKCPDPASSLRRWREKPRPLPAEEAISARSAGRLEPVGSFMASTRPGTCRS